MNFPFSPTCSNCRTSPLLPSSFRKKKKNSVPYMEEGGEKRDLSIFSINILCLLSWWNREVCGSCRRTPRSHRGGQTRWHGAGPSPQGAPPLLGPDCPGLSLSSPLESPLITLPQLSPSVFFFFFSHHSQGRGKVLTFSFSIAH